MNISVRIAEDVVQYVLLMLYLKLLSDAKAIHSQTLDRSANNESGRTWKATVEIWHSIADFASRDRVKTQKAQWRQPGSVFEPWTLEVTSRNVKYSMEFYCYRHKMPVEWNPTTYINIYLLQRHNWIGCKKYEGKIIL